jgi:hypothetical protein
LAKRHGWRRQKGNDGKLRVLVPAVDRTIDRTIDLDKRGDKDRTEPDKGQDKALAQIIAALRSDAMEVVKPLQDAIAVLEAQLTEANARTDRAEQALAGERSRADVLREQLDATRTALATAHTQATDAATRAMAAEEAARIATDALNVARQVDEARRGKGRLRRAWDGWRGR